ncbi:MAG: hypothetical protein A2X40_00160 [Elusimicrobia bacterium GWC2_65_9]|nr:MAG: hypothetical protein A2X37_08495 [Elusimicrobia bacterium GWA2_66_18]OGR73381.1 MAG: hypothetical protein A2X40_00160 [Elusimicrobia bacterium GWC2_65_9]
MILAIASVLLGGCSKAPQGLRTLPDFSLTAVTVDGTSPLDRRALRGRAWVADFVFTRCTGPCPMLTANMAGLQKRLPRKIGLLSFTVDPDHDSPEVLNVYARKFSADPQRWFFVTGEKSALTGLLRDGFKMSVREGAVAESGANITHTTRFVLIDAQTRVRGSYDGEDPAALDLLTADAERL